MSTERKHAFVEYLEGLSEDRTALAALRLGLGQPPGYAPSMFPYIVPFVSTKAGRWEEEAHYIVASLFGLHPVSTSSGNMGSHFGVLCAKGSDQNPVERRFITLLASHPEDLSFYLRQAVSLLKSKEVAVNWHQLMWDVLYWNNPDQRARVSKQWAREFWS